MPHDMPHDSLSPEVYTELVELGRRLYERSLIRKAQEEITDPRGQPIGWLLDTRMPMLESRTFLEVGTVMAERLFAKGNRQVAGRGFGAYAIVGSILSCTDHGTFRGGFVREQRKRYGRKRLVEGPLRIDEPVVIVDDILNSGHSTLRTASLLRSEGYRVEGALTLFSFTWSEGRRLLETNGLWVDSLLDLSLKSAGPSESDSPPLSHEHEAHPEETDLAR
jgi:orotate phosphoribosyltransferase